MLSSLEQQVLATIAYCDQFQYPLSVRQIHQRLVSAKSLGFKREKSVTLASLKRTLPRLQRKKYLLKQGHWYSLAGSTQVFKLRRQRQQIFKQKTPNNKQPASI